MNTPRKSHVLNVILNVLLNAILSVILNVLLNVILNVVMNVILIAKINGTWLEVKSYKLADQI